MAHVDVVRESIGRHWPILGGPVSSSMLVVGLVIVAVAALLSTGVWAGILGIIGILLVTLAFVSRLIIFVYQQL